MNLPLQQKIKSIRHTFCIFQEVHSNTIIGKNPNYISASGSRYYYTEEGMYRFSDHWGRAANSKWYMKNAANGALKTRLGFAKWDSFHKDNPHEQLYFIEYDIANNSVSFNHKNNLSESQTVVLLTAEATTKKIQKIRQLLKNDSWTKYYGNNSIKIKLITTYIASNVSIDVLKKKYLTLQNNEQ